MSDGIVPDKLSYNKGSWSTAQVDGENRSIPIVGGKFTDTFADGNAVHIYRIS